MATLPQQITSLKKQKSFAWAKFYEAESQTADNTNGIVAMLNISGVPRENGELIRPVVLPPHITLEFMEMAEKLNKHHTCPCCLDLVNSTTIHITWCGHILCKSCYEILKTSAGTTKPKCPTCRKYI